MDGECRCRKMEVHIKENSTQTRKEAGVYRYIAMEIYL